MGTGVVSLVREPRTVVLKSFAARKRSEQCFWVTEVWIQLKFANKHKTKYNNFDNSGMFSSLHWFKNKNCDLPGYVSWILGDSPDDSILGTMDIEDLVNL